MILQDILAQLKRNKETGDVLAKELRLNSRAVSRLKAMVALQGGTDSTQTQSLSQEPDRLAELEANLQNTSFREDWVLRRKEVVKSQAEMERLVLNGLGSDPSLLKYSIQGRKGGKLSFLEKCPVLYEVLWSLCMENLNLDEQEAKSQTQMF